MSGSALSAAVVLVSLEPWDDVWRRNQHLAHQLVAQGLVQRLTFVEPAAGRGRAFLAEPGIEVIGPPRSVPNRLGGVRLTARWLRSRVLADASLLWVNDPVIGARCRRPGLATVYDVTDDWRTAPGPRRIRRRVIRAEDALSTGTTVVVCSEELRRRWQQRYDLAAPIVHNGVDLAAFDTARPVALTGPGPHAGYVGTLHSARLDIDLVIALAGAGITVHLVGPDVLPARDRARLQRLDAIRFHSPVPAGEVPGWLRAFDVLVCPHRVTDFTLSLDAIKAYEYLASGVSVVATPTSGFQLLADTAGLAVVDAAGFVDAALLGARAPGPHLRDVAGWPQRAREFAAAGGIMSR